MLITTTFGHYAEFQTLVYYCLVVDDSTSSHMFIMVLSPTHFLLYFLCLLITASSVSSNICSVIQKLCNLKHQEATGYNTADELPQNQRTL